MKKRQVNDLATLDEINASLTKDEYLVIDKEENLVIVFDRKANVNHAEQRIKRIFAMGKDGVLSEVDLDCAINAIIDEISKKVELRQVLTEVIKTSSAEDIVQALKVLKAEKPNIKTSKGCLEITLSAKGRGSATFCIGAR